MAGTLLDILRRHNEQWLSVETLQGILPLDAPAIHQRIEQLRLMGYQIESNPVYGFRLHGTEDRLSSELIETSLNTKRIGRKVLVYKETNSTNDVAWQHADEQGYDGLAVLAEHQRKGRGRLGRNWQAALGQSVLLSVLLQNETNIASAQLTLLAGLCVAEAVEEATGIATRIKWPNDVMAKGRKLAGIMVEARQLRQGRCFVIGMGINCAQKQQEFAPEHRHRAISLSQLTETQIDRVHLTQMLLRKLDQWLANTNVDRSDQLHDRWLARCDIVGHHLELISNGQTFAGRVLDVCCREGLLLQLDDGVVRVFDGSTTSTRP
ncbi:MAG: biotin--[acetyl-CoA-carboxylase] ligase [Sedimentisphaerales bacterium]|nr:biotin--[acetyl-CoA-carboxylase] ligase [Sedimentisphaerales bacterium]